ncbi:MAG: SpoIID/LytB domain-containing protein [Armatimonadota bacterium]|nr:MAG: SpoIID/LytB domain-containing protein [Armatimonadota bacterium]
MSTGLKRLASAIAVGILAVAAAQASMPQVRVGLTWHQSSVVVGSPGACVVADEGQEWRAQGETWTVNLPSSIPEGAKPDPQPPQAEVYVMAGDGSGRWCSLPLRVRANGGSDGGLWAGEKRERLRAYEGELEVIRDAARMLAVVNVVDLEAYARGVVCAEMEANCPPEAFKAQAVATRSMALANPGRHRADGFDLCAEAHCQAYRGITDQMPAGNAAVEATRGEVLIYGGRVANAVYHGACGGHTESASEVWGGADVPYLRGVADGEGQSNPGAAGYGAEDERLRAYLTGAPRVNCRQPDYLNPTRFRWVRVLTRDAVEASLADMVNVGEVMDLRPLRRGVSGRITRLEIRGTRGTSTLSPELVIRRALGGLPSSAFVVDRYCDDAGRPVVFVLWGAGWGHGVGMCQTGAAGMAGSGRGYREILAKYYPGTEVERRY